MNRRFDMVVFDMDGVLVDISSSWKFIHDMFQVDSSNNLKEYLAKRTSYAEFMRRDIGLWGRVHIDKIEAILNKVPLMIGAGETVHRLKAEGFKTAILSAGVAQLADRLRRDLKIDYSMANELVVDSKGWLTGEGVENVNLLDKVGALKKILKMGRVSSRRCVVVGDSIFDIPAFRSSGLSIAFYPSDSAVKEAADIVIEEKDLRLILSHLT